MKINKNLYESKIKNLGKLINILELFFDKKDYNKKDFLKKIKIKIKNDINLELDDKRTSNLLLSYFKYNYHFNKINSLKNKFDNELCSNFNQKGGFFFNKYDNKYMKALTIIDFLFDIINLLPNQIISTNYNFVTMPYAIASLLLNLFRSDYDFAFYSFLGIIPGIGGILASSTKIIHRIIRYIINFKKVENVEEYYKQILAARRVHEFIKDENYEKLDNPYIGSFENEFNYNEMEDLYLK
jgi:hypothetical protein